MAGPQAIFAKALEELEDMSGAKVGDKTMMDALIPASEAVAAYTGDSADELFVPRPEAAAQERRLQAMSQNSAGPKLRDQDHRLLGAGAVSMSWFFQGAGRE